VAINHEVRTGEICSSDTRIVRHPTAIELKCLNIDPDEPLTDAYSFTIYGSSNPYPRADATLSDYQVEDEDGSPKYRKHRGIETPVYEIPKGLAVLSKVRGGRSWSAALWLPRGLVSDMLVLLSREKQLYASIHLRNEDRKLWVQGLDLQTENPLY
jgi:hypothetical protein